MRHHLPVAPGRSARPVSSGRSGSQRAPARAVRAVVAGRPHPPAPAPQQERPPPRPASELPQLPGGLPLVGVYGKYDLFTLYDSLQEQFVAQKVDVLDVRLLGTHSLYLRHPDDVALILRNPSRFVKSEGGLRRLEAWLGKGLFSTRDTAGHAAVKEILMPAFRMASIKGFIPAFVKAAEEVADVLLAVPPGQAYDVEPLCRRATLDVIGRTGFGYEFGSVAFAARELAAKNGGPPVGAAEADLIKMYDQILEPAMWLVFDLPIPNALIPKIKGYYAGIAAVDDVIDKMLAERRANGIPPGATDLLSFMLKAQAEGNAAMTDKQLRDELQTMILAGSDTTATTLAFSLYELSRHPELLAACAAEADAALGDTDPASVPAEVYLGRLPLITGVANETLRLYPAAPQVTRVLVQDEVLGGYAVPAGTIVHPAIYGLHRHEDYWPRPNEWLPERWLPENAPTMAPHADKAWMPFTVGARSCIGRAFAQLELQVVLALLLRKLSLSAVPNFDVTTRATFTLGSRDGVLVMPSPRQTRGE